MPLFLESVRGENKRIFRFCSQSADFFRLPLFDRHLHCPFPREPPNQIRGDSTSDSRECFNPCDDEYSSIPFFRTLRDRL